VKLQQFVEAAVTTIKAISRANPREGKVKGPHCGA
jgi:hypothetical protein